MNHRIESTWLIMTWLMDRYSLVIYLHNLLNIVQSIGKVINREPVEALNNNWWYKLMYLVLGKSQGTAKQIN